jgi:hypothetical protein
MRATIFLDSLDPNFCTLIAAVHTTIPTVESNPAALCAHHELQPINICEH